MTKSTNAVYFTQVCVLNKLYRYVNKNIFYNLPIHIHHTNLLTLDLIAKEMRLMSFLIDYTINNYKVKSIISNKSGTFKRTTFYLHDFVRVHLQVHLHKFFQKICDKHSKLNLLINI